MGFFCLSFEGFFCQTIFEIFNSWRRYGQSRVIAVHWSIRISLSRADEYAKKEFWNCTPQLFSATLSLPELFVKLCSSWSKVVVHIFIYKKCFSECSSSLILFIQPPNGSNLDTKFKQLLIAPELLHLLNFQLSIPFFMMYCKIT